jgi:hypothetical protein
LSEKSRFEEIAKIVLNLEVQDQGQWSEEDENKFETEVIDDLREPFVKDHQRHRSCSVICQIGLADSEQLSMSKSQITKQPWHDEVDPRKPIQRKLWRL